MRILILHSHMTRVGGAQHFIQEVANRLVSLSHEVAIVTVAFLRELYTLDSRIRCISVSNLDASDPRYWLMLPLLVKRMKQVINVLKPDMLIANHFPTNIVLAEANIPGVWMCHEPYPFFHDRPSLGNNAFDQLKARAVSTLYSRYDIYSARKIPIIATNSKFSKVSIYRAFGRNSAVVYPGFDKKILGMKTGKRVSGRVLAISPTAHRKGFEYTLRAFVRLALNGDAEELRIVGRIHPSYMKMIRRVKNTFPNLNVTQLGLVSRSELYKEYASATLLSFPSIAEPFGIVPVESIALGTPVLYFRRGGPNESMIDGVTGLGVEPGNAEQYVEKMKYMLKNPLSIDLDSELIKVHLNRFTWTQATECFLRLCRSGDSDSLK